MMATKQCWKCLHHKKLLDKLLMFIAGKFTNLECKKPLIIYFITTCTNIKSQLFIQSKFAVVVTKTILLFKQNFETNNKDVKKLSEGGTVSSTVALHQENPVFDPQVGKSRSFLFEVICSPMWVYSGCAGLLPQFKNMQIR